MARPLVSDRQGIPLPAVPSAANVNEGMILEELVDTSPPIRQPRGRPRRRPDKRPGD